MQPHKPFSASPFTFLLFIALTLPFYAKALSNEDVTVDVGPVVPRDQRRTLTVAEYGEISAIDIRYGQRAHYHLQFFTLEPNSLFLPVLLHGDMVFYVQTGSGRLTCTDENRVNNVNIRRGDIVRLRAGSVFCLQSSLEAERTKLRIYAIFGNTDDSTYDPSIGAYSSISELIRGFDKKIMKEAFQVPDEVIEAITNRTDPPLIVHAISKVETTFWEWEKWFLKKLTGMEGGLPTNSKKIKTYNIFENDPDFRNGNGWSLTVTKKQLKSLKGTNIGFFMVNLTSGSMMSPHWNPMATEITMVLDGEAMVRVVCGSTRVDKPECQNMRFKVTSGDVFVVPRFHPMAQMSYNTESLVFIGFSTSVKKNHPQFLAGKRSVIQTLDKGVLAASFNTTNTTVDHLLGLQADSIILGCVSCAEEEERIMKEEIEKKKEEEEARKREEEKRKEEEEARKREKERKKEEEEARKREEERKKKEEEARQRQEEEARQREEEERRRQEEEARQREEEERRRQEEEEREREEEERRRQEEEEREREEEERRRQEEEARRRQEEEAREREEEERRRQEEARRRQEEEEMRRQEEEARRRQEEAERRRQGNKLKESGKQNKKGEDRKKRGGAVENNGGEAQAKKSGGNNKDGEKNGEMKEKNQEKRASFFKEEEFST